MEESKARFLIAVRVKHVLPHQTFLRNIRADARALPELPCHASTENRNTSESSPERAVDNNHGVVVGQVEADATGTHGESLEQLRDGDDANDRAGRRSVRRGVEDKKQDQDLRSAGKGGLRKHGDGVEGGGNHGRATCGVDGKADERDHNVEDWEHGRNAAVDGQNADLVDDQGDEVKDAHSGDDLDDRDHSSEPCAGNAEAALVGSSVRKVRQQDLKGRGMQREDGEGCEKHKHGRCSQQLRDAKVGWARSRSIVVESIDDADSERLRRVVGVRLPKESGLLTVLVFSMLSRLAFGLRESLYNSQYRLLEWIEQVQSLHEPL